MKSTGEPRRKKQPGYVTKQSAFAKWVKVQGGLRQAAETIDCTISAVCRWVDGSRAPDRDMGARIVQASQGAVTWEDLYGKFGKPYPAKKRRKKI